MTSDAKIGLLLGLVFIFIIAFVINGLPSFRSDSNNNELTINGAHNTPPALGEKEREVINQTMLMEEQRPGRVEEPLSREQEIRYTTDLPESPMIGKEAEAAKQVVSVQPLPGAKEEKVVEVKPSTPTLPMFYVVKEGDSLALIAKKFYGPEEGNRRINIDRIFKVNQKVLKRRDEIYPEQKLIIPPLTANPGGEEKVQSVFSAAMFKKVESIGRRQSLTEAKQAEGDRIYIVRENDNLWRIAAEKLGDGDLYTEIAKMNADILDDEDTLSIGMRLKLPAQ